MSRKITSDETMSRESESIRANLIRRSLLDMYEILSYVRLYPWFDELVSFESKFESDECAIENICRL
jgi:hypothetical protein